MPFATSSVCVGTQSVSQMRKKHLTAIKPFPNLKIRKNVHSEVRFTKKTLIILKFLFHMYFSIIEDKYTF